jgi:hypothetical protein
MNGFRGKTIFLRGWKSESLEASAATQAMAKKLKRIVGLFETSFVLK